MGCTALGAWLDAKLSTRVARDLLGSRFESVFAASVRDLSLMHALFYIHSGKDLDTLFGTTEARRPRASTAA